MDEEAVHWKPWVVVGCGGELAKVGGILQLTDKAWARAFCCLCWCSALLCVWVSPDLKALEQGGHKSE